MARPRGWRAAAPTKYLAGVMWTAWARQAATYRSTLFSFQENGNMLDVSHRKRSVVAPFAWGCSLFALLVLLWITESCGDLRHLGWRPATQVLMAILTSDCATRVWWTDVARWGGKIDLHTRLLLLLFELRSGLEAPKGWVTVKKEKPSIFGNMLFCLTIWSHIPHSSRCSSIS